MEQMLVMAPPDEDIPRQMMEGRSGGRTLTEEEAATPFEERPLPEMHLQSLTAYWADGSVSMAWRGFDTDPLWSVLEVVGTMECQPFTIEHDPANAAGRPPMGEFIELPEDARLEVVRHPNLGITILKLHKVGWHNFHTWRIVPGPYPEHQFHPVLLPREPSDA